jgi:predicted nucleic acid-binding Zn ribbon protein
MPTHDIKCLKCGTYDEVYIDHPSDEWRGECYFCKGEVKRVFVKPPMTTMGSSGSDREIASMQKSLKERFYKKELDDVRHKHGSAIDESIRGAQIDRIKDSTK